MAARKKVLLIVLDGFGIGDNPAADAIAQASKPFFDGILKANPWTAINASSEDVGLPEGQMGNSEVGHMNIGAGRVVYQEITRINRSIRSGEFFSLPALTGVARHARGNGAALHFLGLLSDGGVHSLDAHLHALLTLAKNEGVGRVFIHALTDGRDTSPTAGERYLTALESKMREIGCGTLATVMGRYYGMDRDGRWERTEAAYRALVEGRGAPAVDPVAAVRESYSRGVTDEFIKPIVAVREGLPVGTVRDGDAVLFFNFRTDRPRQLTRAFIEDPFDKFPRQRIETHFATMTKYHEDFGCPVAFPPVFLTNTLGEILSKLGHRQLHVAETEKYAHVTFFFNGGREEPWPGEERILIPSPRDVPTYDKKPEMSARKITEETVKAIGAGGFQFIVMNYANADMVGHSGNLAATRQAVEVLDECLSKLVPAAGAAGYAVLITADHGNADKMFEPDGSPHTAHTTNRVPFVLIGAGRGMKLRKGGRLADIAPTVLQLMGIPAPKEWDGVSIIA